MSRVPPMELSAPGRWRSIAIFWLRTWLGAVFIAAAGLKWCYPGHGATLYGSLPSMGIHLPIIIIAAEALLGVWPISGAAIDVAALTGVLAISLFTGAIVFDMFQPHPLPCGCMGAAYVAAHSPAAVERGLAMGIARNLFLAILAAMVWLFAPGRPREAYTSNGKTPSPAKDSVSQATRWLSP